MYKVKSIELLSADHEVDCTGHYQEAVIHMDHIDYISNVKTKTFSIINVCRCGKGCSGTAYIKGIVGRKFSDMDRLLAFLYRE